MQLGKDANPRSTIEELCRSSTSVSSQYADSPKKSPGKIAEELYSTHHLHSSSTTARAVKLDYSTEDLDWARRCGRFGETNPSELFLRAYHDLLQCLGDDPLADCTSPSLCGATGLVPITIVAPLNDQLRHMSNLIVRARREVLLATNFWKASGASTFINDALVELSKRAEARDERVVVKIMFDRGDVMQVFNNHQNVSSTAWQSKGIGLPAPEKIPNIDLAIVNFHRPPLGTFHCKFMVVDRQIATVSSNNIQDNDNLEMMSHLEGPIVDSLWDTFIISWHNTLEPPLPCRNSPAAEAAAPSYQDESLAGLFNPNGVSQMPVAPPSDVLSEHMPGEPHHDDDILGEIDRMRSVLSSRDSENYVDAVARHLNKPTGLTVKATAPASDPKLGFFPFISVSQRTPVPMAMASRRPYANLNNDSVFVPQNEAFLSLVRNAKKSIFIQTPDLNAKPLLPAIIQACERGVEVTYHVCLGYNDTGEMLPGQGGTNEMNANHLYRQLSAEKKALLKVFFYVAADQDHPIHNNFKQRSCHIKLLIVDEQVAIQGSGNQDTQSWFHSQEVNVMIDCPIICKAWREGIERNQNTALYGRASDDGCFYDKDGNIAPGSYGLDAGMFSWAKGALGILNKAQGK